VKVPGTPKVSEEAPLIDNPRAAIENAIITENETPAPVVSEEVEETPKEETKVAEDKVELSAIDKIKQNVQKRIDKVVAQKKSAEEELAEVKAENARLRAELQPKITAEIKSEDNNPPTLAQVTAYIIKMREEGNHEEAEKASDYKLQLIEEAAFKKVADRQKKEQEEIQSKSQRENQALLDLAKDYIAYDDKGNIDMKSDMTLANQKGKLFETAMALYNDPELHKVYYNDPDRAMGLRKAVQDANRELHAQGLVKTPKVDGLETRRITRQVLADPDATDTDDTPSQSKESNLLSDAEKVREEIKQRNKIRNSRRVS